MGPPLFRLTPYKVLEVCSFSFHRFRMKVAVVVALLASSAAARPQGEQRLRAADEGEVGGATGDHLFHGSNLWGLEDYHEPAEERKRRAAEEEGAAGDHLFHGSHLWGLEDFHVDTEEREKRTIDYDADFIDLVPLQNFDGNSYSQYNIFD